MKRGRIGLLACFGALLIALLTYSTWIFLNGCTQYTDVTGLMLFAQWASILGFVATGSVIVVYHPQNRIGLLCLWAAGGFTLSVSDLIISPCSNLMHYPTTLLSYWAWFMYTFSDFIVLLPVFILLPSLFPTGRFLSRGWANTLTAGLIVQSLLRLAMAILPDLRRDNAYGGMYDLDNPFGLSSLPDWWYPFFRIASLLWLCGLCLFAIASIITRLRRATGDERQQIKWFAYFLATAVTVQLIFFEIVGGAFYPEIFYSIWYDLIILIVAIGFPTTIAIAIFKYRLYDIDIIINRTLVYGALTILVVGFYALIVSGVGLLFHNESNLATSLLATGIIAVIFQPARAWLQSLANRWLFGERDDPASVLTRLTSQLEQANAGDSLLDTLTATIASSLKLPYVALWLDETTGQLTMVAEIGKRPQQVETIPLLHQQERVGQLDVAPRSPGEALSQADQQLLVAIARLTATTARTIQLTDEVQEARVRTVSAREEERRRLRRDLHDGLGPVLAGQGLKLAAARQLLRDKPEVAERLLDEVMGQSENTVAEVRRLVYALRPPTLDEFGLVGAIREHVETVGVGTKLAITVDAPATMPEIPAAIEVAAFRIVQEALNNVSRHAKAHHCAIKIHLDGALRIVVGDDGVGLPETNKPGVGLQSMRERALEVGGNCVFTQGEMGGVTVRLTLPLENGDQA